MRSDSFAGALEALPTSASTAPELTVAMPAHDAGRFIARAIQSVLDQEGVALELVVVDDASLDDTAAVAESFRDPRVQVLRNARRRGIGACHNTILGRSRAHYVAHVDADDFVLPGALRKMIDALAGDPRAGQAHCYFFDVNAEGHATRADFHRRWRAFRRGRRPGRDYRSALLQSSIANGLRTFPRAVLEELGGFDETLPYAVDYDMALRIVERHTIKLVPEFLYVRRVHDRNTTLGRTFNDARMWAVKYRVRRGLVRRRRITFVERANSDLGPFLLARLRKRRERWRRLLRAAGRKARWQVAAPATAGLYRFAQARLDWWPLDWREARPPHMPGEPRVAYYLRHFPVLSETFIQREVAELVDRGLAVEVIAETPQGAEHFDDQARRLEERTCYLGPSEPLDVRRERLLFLRESPLLVLNLLLYAVLRPWTWRKSYTADVALWRRALRLAGVLRARGITHVHSPWATPEAHVALLAARLAGVRYSIQARASDLHRNDSHAGIDERLAHADFIVTNAHYNVPVIRSRLPAGLEKEVHVVYEGVDPRRLRPPTERPPLGTPPLLLCVARLVEPKGIDVLLRACRILKDLGRAVRCEIVGGKIASETNHYLDLMKLYRALRLEDDVTFLGPRSFAEVTEKYAETDVYVFPGHQASDGRRDVTPNTVIEAMAMELPIVGTRSGAIPELIEDGVSGLLVPPDDEQALAHAVVRMLDDAALRRSLGLAARRRVEERFDITCNAARYAELFGFALRRPPPSR